jgi:predicted cytidylate kinase
MNTNNKSAITISGTLGSGKSTTANMLGELLRYPRYSGGDFMRAMANEQNMTMKEFSERAESDPQIDTEIDMRLKEFMQSNDNYVVDSRLGWFWEPRAYKVFLTLDDTVAARRILQDLESNQLRAAGEHAQSYEDILMKIRTRLASEKTRFQKFYGIENNHDPKHFDLVVDTGNLTPNEVVQKVLDGFALWTGATTQ